MKKYSILIFSILFFCNSVFANVYNYPAKLSAIVKQLPKLESINCKFKQEKHLQNISKPIISSGNFKFVENKGVYFYTTYPIKSTVDYTNKNYKQINDIIKALASKKYSKLEKEFEFFYTKGSDNWTLGLKPKAKSDVHNYLSSITIEGTDYIQKIYIVQTNGNSTKLWFTK